MLSTTEAAASAQLLLNYFSIKCQLNLDIMFATRIEFPALGATKKKKRKCGDPTVAMQRLIAVAFS